METETQSERLDELHRELKLRATVEVLRVVTERFRDRVTMSTGFGVSGSVLLDIAARNAIPLDVFTLDTGLLFPETYALWEQLETRYGMTIRGVRPAMSVDEQARKLGEALWEREPDACCRLRKVVPLEAALSGFDAWITAIRRDQTADRADSSWAEIDERFGVVKVNPLIEWTSDDVWHYVRRYDVPFNPLHLHGFPSIGCGPCTTPVASGESRRAGRWRGRGKTECGLHGRPRSETSRES